VGEVSYKGHRYPAEIIAHCVWLYHRFPLSFREVEELLLVRGMIVSYETIALRQNRCSRSEICGDGVRSVSVEDRSADSDFLQPRSHPGEDPVCQWPPFPRGCGTTMSSSPSSRRRTTPCFVCIESDGIVGNFNARQQTSHARTLRNRRESQRFSAGYVGPNCVWRAREAESIGKRSGIDRERRLQ